MAKFKPTREIHNTGESKNNIIMIDVVLPIYVYYVGEYGNKTICKNKKNLKFKLPFINIEHDYITKSKTKYFGYKETDYGRWLLNSPKFINSCNIGIKITNKSIDVEDTIKSVILENFDDDFDEIVDIRYNNFVNKMHNKEGYTVPGVIESHILDPNFRKLKIKKIQETVEGEE